MLNLYDCIYCNLKFTNCFGSLFCVQIVFLDVIKSNLEIRLKILHPYERPNLLIFS